MPPKRLCLVPLLPHRAFHFHPGLRRRQKPPPPSPPPEDYYSLLLTSFNISTDPSPPVTRPFTSENRPNEFSPPETQPPPTTPTATIVFGSRLAGPAARREQVRKAAENVERPPEPDNCCMSGCVNCVWDVYREEVEEWASQRREKRGVELGTFRQVGSGRSGDRDVKGDSDGDTDGTGIRTYKGVDLRDEGLFEGVPVGIREFMATEKRLRERRGDKGG